jgi:GT2 family glycosyltransferase
VTGEIRPTRPLTYAAVIPTKDRPRETEEAVAVLLDQERLPQQVVVVDASADLFAPSPALTDRAARDGVGLTVLSHRPSTSAQRNAGTRCLDSDLVLFLDDDVRVPSDYAATLLRRWEAGGLHAYGGMAGTPAVVPRQRPFGRFVRRIAMLNYVDPSAEAMTLRRSGNVRYVPEPAGPVVVPALGAGATLYRVDLALACPFDERFDGYAPGEDLDMAWRVGEKAPLIQTPEVKWTHLWDPRERSAPARWRVRGRCETYFRLRRLDRTPAALVAFALSLVSETGVALADTLRERDLRHVRGFVSGAAESLLRDRRSLAGR